MFRIRPEIVYFYTRMKSDMEAVSSKHAIS